MENLQNTLNKEQHMFAAISSSNREFATPTPLTVKTIHKSYSTTLTIDQHWFAFANNKPKV